MPRVTFVNQSVQDQDNIAASPARLLNLYPVPVAGEGRTTYALKSVLGQDTASDIGVNPVRAMGKANEKLWLVGDSKLYELAFDGVVTQRGGAIADDSNTTIAGNYTDVTVVCGNKYYLWDGSSITEPTTKTFTNVGSHCYIGGYTVLTEKDGRRFQWSALGDASTLDALDFARADKVDDNILRAVEWRGNLLILKDTSTEIWQLNPDAPDTAERFFYASASNTGLKSFNLLVRFDDALFFVGNDNRAYLFGQGVVSNPSVETAIAQDTPTHCWYYEDEGNKFCVIRFSDRPAWVYDITTGLWHERAEGPGYTAWRATCSARNVLGNPWLVGNEDGQVMLMSRINSDIASPLYRRAVSSTIYLGDRKFTIPKVEALARVGDHDLTVAIDFALAGDDGAGLLADGSDSLAGDSIEAGPRDAWLNLFESFDGGRTWRGPFPRSLGRLDDFDKRMVWRARGQAQQYTMRFEISEPADITLYSDGLVTAV